MTTKKREFTGVWIPAHIIEDESLTPLEKMLFAEIASFRRCFISNAGFAKRLGITERWVQKNIKKLKDKGYVKQVSFNGRSRTIIAIFDEQGCHEQSDVADTNNSSPIDNNRENNKDTETKVSEAPKEELDNIAKLFYLVLKKYSLPTVNNNNVRKWISELKQFEDSEQYLNLLLVNDLRMADREFRPTLNTAFDILNKKVKIQRFYNDGEDSPRDPRVFGEL